MPDKADKITFTTTVKITDAVFIVRTDDSGTFGVSAVLKIYADIGDQPLIDGDVREIKAPQIFTSEEAAEDYATDKAREFGLESFRFIGLTGGERVIET